jgi:hydrogenase maturation factor
MPGLPVGKLRAELLERLFDKHVPEDARVVVGPRVGEDAAVIDMGDRYLVATADPITFATDEAGWYALHVNANDLAVRGARPLWFLATVLLPEGKASEERVETLFGELAAACAELGVALVGGHTEVTAGLPRVIVSGCMLGEVAKDRLVTTGGARVGDTLLLTKGAPLEGAAILARECGDEARRRGVPADVIERARGFLRRPGISVVPEARLACAAASVHAMHDPTEGGVATACWEMAQAAGVGLRVDRERIPVLSEGRVLCEAFGLDPLGAIASGSLLLAVGRASPPPSSPRVAARASTAPPSAASRRHRRASRSPPVAWPGRCRVSSRTRSPKSSPEADPGKGIGRCRRSGTRSDRRPWDARAWSPRVIRSPRWRASRSCDPAAMWWTPPSPPMPCSASPSRTTAAWAAICSVSITRR